MEGDESWGWGEAFKVHSLDSAVSPGVGVERC